MKKITQYIIPLNLLFDIALGFFDKGGVLSMFRAGLMLFIILPIILRNIKNNKHYRWNIIFCIYVLINILFSTNIVVSATVSLKIVISISTFIVGFNFFSSPKNFKVLNNSIFYVLIILLLNFIISNVFKIGRGVYDESNSFLVGNLRDNWNVFTYSLLLVPLLIHQFKNNVKKKYLIYFLSIANGIILLLSIKRIAITGLFLGLLIYSLLTLKVTQLFKNLIIFAIIIISTFPLYGDMLITRLDARSDRFEEGSLEKEARYHETLFVWEEVISFKKPIKSLFGLEAFNSVGNYADGAFGQRNLHVDYNLIINTIGIIGFLFYFNIFFEIYKNYKRVKKKIRKKLFENNSFIKKQKAFIFIFLLLPFFTSFAGQMYSMTFRMIIFIYLGANLGSLMRVSKQFIK